MEILSWGKSMYGGWYINFLQDGIHTGKHFLKKVELQLFARSNNMLLAADMRMDN